MLAARIAQLVLTATAVPGVTLGAPAHPRRHALGLFPGVDASQPITPAALRRPNLPPPTAPTIPEEPDPTVAVRALQQALADLGYLPAEGDDGVAGEQTRFAVVAFQKWEGLGRDGVVGPMTRAALAKAKRPTPRTPAGAGVSRCCSTGSSRS